MKLALAEKSTSISGPGCLELVDLNGSLLRFFRLLDPFPDGPEGQIDNFGVTSKSHIVDFRLIHFKFSMAFETISCLETLTFDGFSNR